MASIPCFSRILLLSVLAHPAVAQIPGLEKAPSTAAQQPADPYERNTPRGTIGGFTRSVHREDFTAAARYLQVTPSERPASEVVARDLTDLLDRYFDASISSISDSPEGTLTDDLPNDRERIGPLRVGEPRFYVELVRVTDPQVGPVWLISSGTLAQVPALHASLQQTWIERLMPPPLVRRSLFGVSLAQWILLAASIVAPFLLFWFLSGTFIVFARRLVHGTRRPLLDAWYAGLRRPAILALTLAVHSAVVPFLGLPLSFRIPYRRVAGAFAIVALAWLIRELVSLLFERARSLVHGPNSTGTRSLMMLGERLLNVIVVMAAILMVLTIVGVDTKTALAGVGIGGVAIALGAQKTVENVLGGVFLLSDRALAVGDKCSIANRVGVVEDITLRSVRLRTDEQTLVSIPAGSLSQSSIENFASLSKTLMKTTVQLRYGTTAEQLRSILGRIRQLLVDHPKLETESSSIRLVDLGERAVKLELSTYVLTANGAEFAAVREEVLLQVVSIVETSGSAFAQPLTQLVYVDDRAAPHGVVHDAGVRDDVRFTQPTPNLPTDAKPIATPR